jgi:predicted transcriptional regulator
MTQDNTPADTPETDERKPGTPPYVGAQWPVTINYSDTEDVERRLYALARQRRISRSALLREIVSPGLSAAERQWSEGIAAGAARVEDGQTNTAA